LNARNPYQPIYRQFIHEIEKGFLLLDETSGKEIREFVAGQQHQNGAFTNRGGHPDMYYSLFGVWLSEALGLTPQMNQLKTFSGKFQTDKANIVEQFALLLIQVVADNDFKKPSVFSLVKMIFEGGKAINPAYQVFLFLLSFDALYGKNRWLYFIFRVVSNFYRLPKDAPCSISAAVLVAKYLVGKNVEKEIQNQLLYFEAGKGFKVFKEVGNADMLSTAVALFALKKAGADLRMVAPDCLNLIQQNYDSGAFLSGDGDASRDLEYTFYGLLALGTLS